MAESNINKEISLDAYDGYISDCNNCKTTGVFRGTTGVGTANLPENGYFVIMIFSYRQNTDLAQFAVEVNTSKTYMRVFHDNSTWSSWKRLDNHIKTANVSGTSDSNGNININSYVGSGKIIISFARNSNGYDGVYTPFYSPAGTCYIHVADWNGAKAASATVSGTVYYTDK